MIEASDVVTLSLILRREVNREIVREMWVS